jgi:hypothetical protein
VTEAAVVTAPRERGWVGLLLGLTVFLLVPSIPWLRTALPVEQTWVLLFPALAACALAGWRAGGRLSLALIWCALAAWVLAHPVSLGGGASGSYDHLARGWATLLAAAFGLLFLVGRQPGFLSRALPAVAIALAVAGSLVLAGGGAGRVRETVARESARRESEFAAALDARWDEFSATPRGREVLAQQDDAQELPARWAAMSAATRGVAVRYFPALLALESLAALAFAWALYHRVSRVRIGPPLGTLRNFRFNDQLVWGLVVGITLLVLPSLNALRGAGFNLTFFFGVLYALRGLGVLVFLFAPSWFMAAVISVLVVLLSPFGALGAMGLGLSDTWLDLRRRPSPSTPASN